MPRGHYLTEAVKDAIWVLRAEGVSEAEIGRRLGVPKRTVSKYLQRMGGIRPRPRRRAEWCLTLAEREEISRGIARGDVVLRPDARGFRAFVNELEEAAALAAWQIWRADRWAPACRAVGLEPVPRPYDLRHSFASLLLAEGKQPIWCAKQLGHTLAVFPSTYAHLIDEFEDRERIDADAEITRARREVGTRLVRTTGD
jgi:transcriptional regulator with XRE-family HTH domain